MPDARTAYTVTQCRTCEGFTAIVVEGNRYGCVECGETGTYRAGGWSNVPDARPDVALRVVLAGIVEASPTLKDFKGLCRLHTLQHPKLKEVARARPLG